MLFWLTLTQIALGDCTADHTRWAWPPHGATIPQQPELTITGHEGSEPWLITDSGERFELIEVWTGDRQRVLQPTAPLPPGPVSLIGLGRSHHWIVSDEATPPQPHWRTAPSLEAVIVRNHTRPPGTRAEASVPLVGAERQPLVEISTVLTDGSSFRRRFQLTDDRLVLDDGCGPPFAMPDGARFELQLIGIDARGRRTEPRTLELTMIERP